MWLKVVTVTKKPIRQGVFFKLNKMIVELDKKDLANLVRGVSPYYDLFDHPLITKCGSWVGGMHDHWRWYYAFEDKLTEEELYEVYFLCKNSWKHKKKDNAL